MLAQVLVPNIMLNTLSYLIPPDLDVKIGSLVKVNIRSKEVLGVVYEIKPLNNNETFNIKPITALVDNYQLNHQYLKFLLKFADYNMINAGAVWKLAMPIELTLKKKQIIPYKQVFDHTKFTLPILSTEQQQAYIQIDSHPTTSLLQGITGSGKTEIYFHLTADLLKLNRQILIMLPEIALTSQMLDRFKQRFNFEPVIWNSSIGLSQKRRILLGIMTGEVKLIIGSRSALLLPYQDLALIIVDEEHDASYKQDESIVYNARDMAILRGAMTGFKVLLTSATPAIETYLNALEGKYKHIRLGLRYGVDNLPAVKAIDLSKETIAAEHWISPTMIAAVNDSLNNNYQVLLFLNRRGYAPLMLCKNCGYRCCCKSCSAWLVYHKAKKYLACHHCGQTYSLKSVCNHCKTPTEWLACGPGVERIALEAAKIFPGKNIQIVTKDTMQKLSDTRAILHKIINHEIDIIIGTQIITKGYHFPLLNLVGVIDGDFGLNGGDLKAAERTYQLLNQVGGRAGREGVRGKVYIQTYHPNSIILQAMRENNEEKFYNYEIDSRKKNFMPPYSRMAAILLSGRDEQRTLELALKFVQQAPIHDDLKILGPAPSLMFRLKNKFRYRILIICHKKYNLQDLIKRWLALSKLPSWANVKIDIDPYSFY